MPANVHDPDAVDAYMERLDHPLKAEVQAVRDLIKGVDSRITEQVNGNAPSVSYLGYLATFNLRPTRYPDRRMTYFTSMAEVEAKRPAMEALVRQWVELMDQGD